MTSSSTCYITLAYHSGRTSEYSRKSIPSWVNSYDKTQCFCWNFLDFFLTFLFLVSLLKTQRKKNPLFYMDFQILQVSGFFSKLNDLSSSSISIYSSLLLILLIYFQYQETLSPICPFYTEPWFYRSWFSILMPFNSSVSHKHYTIKLQLTDH